MTSNLPILHTTSYIKVINYVQGWEPVMQGKRKMYWSPNFIPWAYPKFYPKVHPLNLSGSYYCESLVMVEWFYFYIINRKLGIGNKMSDVTKLFLLAWIAQYLQNHCPSPLLGLRDTSALCPFREGLEITALHWKAKNSWRVGNGHIPKHF